MRTALTLACLVSASAISGPSFGSSGFKPGVFGSVTIPIKAASAMDRARPAVAEAARCATEDCFPAGTALDGIMQDATLKHFPSMLADVNRGVNGMVRYRMDSYKPDSVDSWATPRETLANAAGDCEDFAVLKLAVLARLGVALDAMSVVVLHMPEKDAYHAVLAVKDGEGFRILDNLKDEPSMDAAEEKYVPLYSLNGEAGWLHGKRKAADGTGS